MDLLFTDLDGTLLAHDSYAWDAAKPALERLRRRGIPWMFVTSKTRAEVEFWRQSLGNAHPFIVENGGAAYVPGGYFPQPVGEQCGAYEAIEWGTRYESLVADLAGAADASRCRVRGFHAMTAEEVAEACGLPLEQAVLAKQREYDEPFTVHDEDRAGALVAAIEVRGRRWTRGGRFWHILGASDKARAVAALVELFGREHTDIRTIGLGDGLNDASFLDLMSVPVLIRSPQADELKRLVPRGRTTDRPGPEGWNDAVLALTGE